MKFSTRFCAIVLSVGAFAAQAAPVTLTTAAQDNSPKFVQQGGKMGGIAVDVLRALEKIDPELKFTGDDGFWPMKRIENGLLPEVASGPEHIDLFVGMAKTPEREKKYRYVTPMIYSVKNVVFVRANDDVKISSLEDISKMSGDNQVLANNGYVQATTAKAVPGLKVDDGAKTNSDNLKKLIDGKGRFFYASELSGFYEAKQDGVTKQIKALHVSGDDTGQFIAVSNTVPKAVFDRLEAAVKKLVDSGEMGKILAKYK